MLSAPKYNCFAQIRDTSKPVIKYKPDEILFFCPDTLSRLIETKYLPYNLRIMQDEYPETWIANERLSPIGKLNGLKGDVNKFKLNKNIYKYKGDGKKIKCIVVNGYSYYFRKHHDLPLDPKDFPNLEEINVTANLCWPENIGDFKQIKHLNLLSSFTGYNEWDGVLINTYVYQYHIPSSIYKLVNLEELYIDHDYPIDSRINNLKKLKVFYFNRSGINSIEVIESLRQIYFPFSLINNKKLILPNRDKRLSNLYTFNIFRSRLKLFSLLDSLGSVFNSIGRNAIQTWSINDTISNENSRQVNWYCFKTVNGLLTDTLSIHSYLVNPDSSMPNYYRKTLEIYKSGNLQPIDCYDSFSYVHFRNFQYFDDTSVTYLFKKFESYCRKIHFLSAADFEIKYNFLEGFNLIRKNEIVTTEYEHYTVEKYNYKKFKLVNINGAQHANDSLNINTYLNLNEKQLHDLYIENVNSKYAKH
jgi:hypothetical protein